MNFSEEVRNARCDAIAPAIGVGNPILRIRTGPVPPSAESPDAGTVLAVMTLPDNWLADASDGSVAKSGLWQVIAAEATGTPGHFRIYDSAGSFCHIQGTVGTNPPGGYDMIVSTATITVGQTVTVAGFTIMDGNA